MQSINTRQFREIVEWTIDANLVQPILALGAPGIGKSEIVAEIAAERGYYLEDLRLAQMSEVELAGLIYPDKDKNDQPTDMKWLRPDWMSRVNSGLNGNGKSILLLDEITSATKRVQVAAYQLVLDRRVGNHKLGDGVVVIALGNRADDNGVFVELAAPLANRFEIYDVQPNFNIWVEDFTQLYIDKRSGKGFNAAVVAYLNETNGAELHTQDEIQDSDEMIFATPRTWKRVSDIVNVCEDKYSGHQLDSTAKLKIRGSVGDKAGNKFIQFYEKFQGLTIVSDLREGNEPAKLQNTSQELYALQAVKSWFTEEYKKIERKEATMGDVCVYYNRIQEWANKCRDNGELGGDKFNSLIAFFGNHYNDVVIAAGQSKDGMQSLLNSTLEMQKQSLEFNEAVGNDAAAEEDRAAIEKYEQMEASSAFQII